MRRSEADRHLLQGRPRGGPWEIFRYIAEHANQFSTVCRAVERMCKRLKVSSSGHGVDLSTGWQRTSSLIRGYPARTSFQTDTILQPGRRSGGLTPRRPGSVPHRIGGPIWLTTGKLLNLRILPAHKPKERPGSHLMHQRKRKPKLCCYLYKKVRYENVQYEAVFH